jgi:hypothetical protein
VGDGLANHWAEILGSRSGQVNEGERWPRLYKFLSLLKKSEMTGKRRHFKQNFFSLRESSQISLGQPG